MRGGRGWHGGISMNDEKDGIVEKACTVWSALGRELRLCLEITKVIRTITESMWRRSNETFAILSASIRTFYELSYIMEQSSKWIIFSALKKLMDIRWIANLRSSAWILSWLWRVKYENLALNFFVIRGDMCPNGFYAQKKRSQSDRCTVAFSNIAMFQYFNISGIVSFH